MKARVTVITLGVDDLERSLAFYRDGLGFPTKGIVGTEFEYSAVVFFKLQPGLQLALWPRASLAHDAGLARTPSSPTELSLGHNVNSAAEVDAAMEQAAHAGAHIIKPAERTFYGGYAGYFQDPDGHGRPVRPHSIPVSPITGPRLLCGSRRGRHHHHGAERGDQRLGDDRSAAVT